LFFIIIFSQDTMVLRTIGAIWSIPGIASVAAGVACFGRPFAIPAIICGTATILTGATVGMMPTLFPRSGGNAIAQITTLTLLVLSVPIHAISIASAFCGLAANGIVWTLPAKLVLANFVLELVKVTCLKMNL
jgi:hypothetical protein